MGACPHGRGSGLAVTPSLCDLSTSFSLSERIAPTAVGFLAPTVCEQHRDLITTCPHNTPRHRGGKWGLPGPGCH